MSALVLKLHLSPNSELGAYLSQIPAGKLRAQALRDLASTGLSRASIHGLVSAEMQKVTSLQRQHHVALCEMIDSAVRQVSSNANASATNGAATGSSTIAATKQVSVAFGMDVFQQFERT
jgi:hypothetical protein